MKLDIFQKIGIGIGTIFMILILYSTLSKNKVSYGDLEYINGQLVILEHFKFKNKWSVSYDIKLKNNSSDFKIKPEYFDCFNLSQTDLNKMVGQQVTLGIDKDKGLNTNDLKEVVSLKFGEKEYIDFDCVNHKIERDKIQILLIMIGGIILFFLVIWGNNRLKK